MGPLLLAGLGIGSKLIGGLFGASSKKKQEQAQRDATVAGLNLNQTMGEDRRLARLKLAESLLGGIGQSPAYGGRVNPNTALDPNLVAALGARRSYDFSKTVPKAGAGMGSAFLSGLFGDLGSAALSPTTGSNDMLGNRGPAQGVAQDYTVPGIPTTGYSFDELMKLSKTGG